MSGETCEDTPLAVVVAGLMKMPGLIGVYCETRAALEKTASEKKLSGDDTFHS